MVKYIRRGSDYPDTYEDVLQENNEYNESNKELEDNNELEEVMELEEINEEDSNKELEAYESRNDYDETVDYDALKPYWSWDYYRELDQNQEVDNKVDPTDPETIPKFVDRLPIPAVAKPVRQCNSSKKEEDLYVITMKEAKHRFHKNFPLTTIWGYNGTYSGPTFNVRKDKPVKVRWDNNLPDKHILHLKSIQGIMYGIAIS